MDIKKKKVLEEVEKIEAMGQESEVKGKKATQEVVKEKQQIEKKKEEIVLDTLDTLRKRALEYRKFLLIYLHNMVLEISWPQGYKWGVWYDGKGTRLSIKNKFGKLYQRAFRISYQPKYDSHMCYVFAVWAEDVLDLSEGRLSITQNKGIWTPPMKKQN